ncbi:hypothetical protein [Streptomyces pseudogriseolus]|uniref:hypothetical protein n=1 Tax=Streptomyces pseudogriseolus TaxID=36817 RepID=UPI00346EC414
MDRLDGFIKKHVASPMRASGFSKKGRVFRFANLRNDHLFMELERHSVDPEKCVFDVHFWIVPLSHWEFVNRQYVKSPAPDISGALVTFSVIPPTRFAYEPEDDGPFRSRWAFADPQEDSCGEELARRLEYTFIPQMMRLLDREALLREILPNPNGELVRLRNAVTSEIMLRIDDAPIESVQALVDKAEMGGEFLPLIQWARQRLARRSSNAPQ